jgi:hypothetical protein
MKLKESLHLGKSKADPGITSLDKIFALPSEDTILKIFARDNSGRLTYIDSIALADVDLETFEDRVKETAGGGRFHVVPYRRGNRAAPGLDLRIDAPRKNRRSKEDQSVSRSKRANDETVKELEEFKRRVAAMEDEKREDRLIQAFKQEFGGLREQLRTNDGSRRDVLDSVLANLPQVIEGFGGLRSKESSAEQLERLSTTIRNLQQAIPQAPDPMESVNQITDLIFRIAQANKPPPTVTGQPGRGGFMAGFLANLLGEIDRRLGGGNGIAAGASPGVLPQGMPAAGLAGMPAQQGGGFSGIDQGGTGPPTSPLNLSLFNFQALGIDPLRRIREMIAQRAEPTELANMIVATLDFVMGFSPPNSPIIAHIRGFMLDPGEGFDKIAPHVPELQGDSEYIERLRSAVIAAVAQYWAEVQQQHGGGEATFQGSEPEAEPAEPGLNVEDFLKQEPEAQRPEPHDQAESEESSAGDDAAEAEGTPDK